MWITDFSTCGELSIEDGPRECFTVELPNKDGRPGSCIAQGRYKLSMYLSPHFGVEVPLLSGVPDRDDDAMLEIHWGNTAADVKGCIAVGKTHEMHLDQSDFIGSSREAWTELMAKICASIAAGDCWITIIGGASPS
jgi:hypothetical protein